MKKQDQPNPRTTMSEAKEVTSPVANQPKKRSCWRGCFIAVLLLALPVWWFCLHTTPLRISKETTYVLAPMTKDGKRIDYFRAMEERFYPPEMKTDDNGYRLVVRAFGVQSDVEPLRLQVYEKLGLNPNIEPTMKPIESPWNIINEYDKEKEHLPAEGEGTWGHKYQNTLIWTFEDFPMLKEWYNENTAGIDHLVEAVRKPTFFLPYVREDENMPMVDAMAGISLPDTIQQAGEWARAVQARAQYRLGIGSIDEAIDDIVAIHHLARHTSKQGTLFAGLVGIAIEEMARAIGIGSNPEFQPTKEQIERLVRELDALPPRVTYADVLEQERYFGLGVLQDMYRGINTGIGNDIMPLRFFPAMSWTIDFNIAMTKYNQFYDALLTPGEVIEGTSWNPLPLLFVRSRTNRFVDTLAALIVPSGQPGQAWRRIECVENIQRLTLATLLHEKEHRSLPEGDWREAIGTYLGDNANRYFQCPSHSETNYAMISGVTF